MSKDTPLVTNDDTILYVFSDIETDNIQSKYLLQIAAVTQDNKQFNEFINPFKSLPLSTTNFLGIYYYKSDLYRNGLKLRSKPIEEVLKLFMNWIEKLGKPVVLIFHNGLVFDAKVLSQKLVQHNVEIPKNLVSIGDTLPYFRRSLKPPLIENHKLGTLARYFNIEQSYAHDALSDTVTLKLICDKFMEQFEVDLAEILKHSQRKFIDYITNQVSGTPLPKLNKPKKKTRSSSKSAH